MKQKLILAALLAALFLTACADQSTLPSDTVLTGQSGQQLWYSPGGDEAAEGYIKKLVATLSGGEQMVVTPNNDGDSEIPVYGVPTQLWVRVVITTTTVDGIQKMTGWINFTQMK